MHETDIILTHILNCRRVDLHVDRPVLTKEQQQQFNTYVARRQAGEPLQYILGTCNFFGLEFKVNPSVLVPRPETEILVEEAIKRFKGSAILDIGTGSGNIAVTLAKHIPHARITSVDISAAALAVARENAAAHDVEDRIDFIQADIFQHLSFPKDSVGNPEHDVSRPPTKTFGGDSFDLIISNPPYIPSRQMAALPVDVQKEPAVALDGGEDGLKFYKIIIKNSPLLLRKGACLMMEFGDGQASALRGLCEQTNSFSSIEILRDLTVKERILSAIEK